LYCDFFARAHTHTHMHAHTQIFGPRSGGRTGTKFTSD